MKRVSVTYTLGVLALGCMPLVAFADTKSPKWPTQVSVFIPEHAVENLPILLAVMKEKWPDYPYPYFLAAQVEQETCISLKHSKCWTEKAELKTSREYGFGFAQTTIAYNKDGTERFNAWKDVKAMDKDLMDWKFEDRYNKRLSMMSLVVRDKFEYKMVGGAKDDFNRSCFMFNSYNGGRGGMLADRRLCKTKAGCDPSQWFGHVELYSYKSEVVTKGYGKSFKSISREYVDLITKVRSDKYIPYFH